MSVYSEFGTRYEDEHIFCASDRRNILSRRRHLIIYFFAYEKIPLSSFEPFFSWRKSLDYHFSDFCYFDTPPT